MQTGWQEVKIEDSGMASWAELMFGKSLLPGMKLAHDKRQAQKHRKTPKNRKPFDEKNAHVLFQYDEANKLRPTQESRNIAWQHLLQFDKYYQMALSHLFLDNKENYDAFVQYVLQFENYAVINSL